MSDGERTAVIVGAARLPTGRFLGGLSSLAAPQLGAKAIAAAVERSGVDPNELDDVIMGNVVQAGVSQAPARQAAIAADPSWWAPRSPCSGCAPAAAAPASWPCWRRRGDHLGER